MSVYTIDVQHIQDLLSKEEATLVDVREPAEYASEHIENALLVPLAKVNHQSVPITPQKRTILYCQSGRRSDEACAVLTKRDPSIEVWSMQGGLNAWKTESLPTVKGKRRIIPLDRQVQIAAGTFILATSLLGYFVSNHFILLTIAIGAGLFQAGITGWCGLAKVISRLPWNQIQCNKAKGE